MSISADGYEDLRAAIVGGELLPGERLLEEELSARLGLGRAAVRADDVTIDVLRDIVGEMRRLREAGDLLALSNLNARLHARILEASGHDTAKRLSRMLSSQIVRFQYRTVLLPGRPGHSFAEHSAIVEAIAARDPDAAENAMRHHLLRLAEALRTQHAVEPPDAAAVRAVQD